MVPCCQQGEQQYLDIKGTPKPAWIEAKFGKTAVVSVEEDRDTAWGKSVFKRLGFYPENTIVTICGTPTQLCTCPCHFEGSLVMH